MWTKERLGVFVFSFFFYILFFRFLCAHSFGLQETSSEVRQVEAKLNSVRTLKPAKFSAARSFFYCKFYLLSINYLRLQNHLFKNKNVE